MRELNEGYPFQLPNDRWFSKNKLGSARKAIHQPFPVSISCMEVANHQQTQQYKTLGQLPLMGTHRKHDTVKKNSLQKTSFCQEDLQKTNGNTPRFNQPALSRDIVDRNLDFGKLRDTNSTNCVSPKGTAIQPYDKSKQFRKIKVLGKGNFGTVYLVQHIYSGFIAALKVISKREILKKNKESSDKALIQLIREIKIQMYLNHPNLIKMYDFFSDQNNIYLLLELGCDGQLYELLQRAKSFKQESVSIIIRQIADGVSFMHSKNIIHRDIKMENIVLSHGFAKLCDFGWSVYCFQDYRSTMCGTPLYLSPEILKGRVYNEKIDTWAIGALSYELFTGENAFGITREDQLSRIVTEQVEMDVGSPAIRSFVTFILKKNPYKRPDAATILRHPFIEDYRGIETSEEICNLTYRKAFRH